jgi:hypothetical protein
VLRRAFNFEAQFDRFANALGDFVQRSRLCVASGELRDRGNVVAFLITFNDDVELALQWSVLSLYSRRLFGPDFIATARRLQTSNHVKRGRYLCIIESPRPEEA